MDKEPIKRAKSFVPNVFKAFSVFIFVALCSFFGGIQLISPSTALTPMTENPSDAEEEVSYFGEFVTAIMSFENIDTDFELSFTGANSSSSGQASAASTSTSLEDISLSVKGNVVFDESGLALNVALVYNGTSYDVQAVYFNDYVYLTIDDNTFKYDITSYQVQSADGSSSMDISALVNFAMTALNIDTSFIADIEDLLGVDFDNFDANALLNNLKTTEEALEGGGYKLNLSYRSLISAVIYCDDNFNIISVETNNILIKNNALKFTANVNAMNDTDVNEGGERPISVSYTETGEEIDLSGLGLYAGYLESLLAEDYAGGTFTFTINNVVEKEGGAEGETEVVPTTYTANWTLDNSGKEPILQISTKLSDTDLVLTAYGTEILLDVCGLKLKFDASEYKEYSTVLDKFLTAYFGTTIKDEVMAVLSKYITFDESGNVDLSATDLINQILGALGGSGVLNAYMPTNVVLSKDSYQLQWLEDVVDSEGKVVSDESGKATQTQLANVKFTQTDGLISSVSAEYDKYVANLTFGTLSEGLSIAEGDYFDLQNLLSLVDYISGGQFKFTFTATYNGFDISGNLLYDFESGELEITATILEKTLSVHLANNVIYVSYANINYSANLSTASTSSSTSFMTIVQNLVSDAYGVDVQFGVFEEILGMLSTYEIEDYINNLVLSGAKELTTTDNTESGQTVATADTPEAGTEAGEETDGSEDGSTEEVAESYTATFTLNKKGSYLTTNILKLVLAFTNGEFTGFDLSVYDVLSLSATVDDSLTFSDVDTTATYSTDITEALLDSMEVSTGIYAISSDLAVRYSTTTFYGSLTAMLVEDETAKGLIDGYKPAILVETSSLGLSSYIYVIDETVYIDINGLQVKADLNTTTISDVLTRLVENFNITALSSTLEAYNGLIEETANAFMVILPAIDQIYASWVALVKGSTKNGIQIDIADKLQYGETSWFDDIVAQVFLDTSSASIIPTQIVLGANITDPNTDPDVIDETDPDYIKAIAGMSEAKIEAYREELTREYYSSYLLSANSTTIETSVTDGLNFAVYLTNISLGSAVSNLSDVFVAASGETYKTFSSVLSNSGTTALADFSDYDVLLDAAESVYNYALDYEYQMTVDFNITSITDSTAKTSLSGDVIAAASKLEGATNASGIKLFNDMQLKVQGNLLLSNYSSNTITSLHALDVYYDSNDYGLYASYSHDNYADDDDKVTANNNYTNGNEFNVKIKNSEMSNIISMLVKFLDLDLGETMEDALNITENTTDFDFICNLLGMGETISDDTVSKVDGILSSVTAITSMIDSITLSRTKILDEDNKETGLYQTTLALAIDMASLNGSTDPQIATISIILNEETDGDTTTLVLRGLSIENLIFGTSVINGSISFEDYDANNFDYFTGSTTTDSEGNTVVVHREHAETSHIDMSNISSFVDTAVNTLNQRTITYSGVVSLNVISVVSIDISLDMSITIDEDGEIYAYIQMGYDPSLLASGLIDGDASVIEYNANGDHLITLHRYGDGAEKTLTKSSYTLSELLGKDGDGELYLYTFLQDLMGLGDTIMDYVKTAIASIDAHPTLEQAITGFTTSDTVDLDGKKGADGYIDTYSLSVDGANLMGISGATLSAVELGVAYLSGTYTNSEGEKLDKVYGFIDSIATKLSLSSLITIGINLTADKAKSDTTCSSMNSTSGYYLTDTIGSLAGGKKIYLASYYRNRVVNEYSVVMFETNGGNAIEDVYGSYGETFTLETPTKDDLITYDSSGNPLTKTVYTFDGWYTTEDFQKGTAFNGTTIPKGYTTLYAKWTPDVLNYRTITFDINSSYVKVDESEIENTVLAAENATLTAVQYDTITLPNNLTMQTKVEEEGATYVTTYTFAGWYTTATCDAGTEFTSTTMPTGDITLYAKWEKKNSTQIAYLLQVYDVDASTTEAAHKVYIAEGENVDLSGYSKTDAVATEFYQTYSDDDGYSDKVDLNETTKVATSLTMTSALTLYVRNQYTLTYTYYTVKDNTFVTYKDQTVALWQGETYTLVEQSGISYVDTTTDNELDYRTYYAFNGYSDGTKSYTTSVTMSNSNLIIYALYNTQVVEYYTLIFNLSWTKPEWWWLSSGTCETAPKEVSAFSTSITISITVGGEIISQTIKDDLTATVSSERVSSARVQYGATIDLTSISTITCTYSYTLSYNFQLAAWATTGVVNLYTTATSSQSTSGYYTSSYTFSDTTKSSSTLFAVWKHVSS